MEGFCNFLGSTAEADERVLDNFFGRKDYPGVQVDEHVDVVPHMLNLVRLPLVMSRFDRGQLWSLKMRHYNCRRV